MRQRGKDSDGRRLPGGTQLKSHVSATMGLLMERSQRGQVLGEAPSRRCSPRRGSPLGLAHYFVGCEAKGCERWKALAYGTSYPGRGAAEEGS